MILSKDQDFVDRGTLYGPPPIVIHLNLGNCSNVSAHPSRFARSESVSLKIRESLIAENVAMCQATRGRLVA